MVNENRITLVIEGLPEDDGRVRFAAFLNQLNTLNATISRLDREANGKAGNYFQIAELSYASPVRVSIEPQALPGRTPTGHLVIEGLTRIADAFENEDDILDFDAELLEDFRSLALPVGTKVRAATILFNDHRIDLSPQIASRVDAALAVDEECEGGVEGMLEQINLHGGANIFSIYPEIGPKKLACHFPARLYDDAVAAVGRKVHVKGTLTYRARKDHPHLIQVSEIDVYEPESLLPDWEDLRGRAPDLTGGFSSEDFVRELRNAWR